MQLPEYISPALPRRLAAPDFIHKFQIVIRENPRLTLRCSGYMVRAIFKGCGRPPVLTFGQAYGG